MKMLRSLGVVAAFGVWGTAFAQGARAWETSSALKDPPAMKFVLKPWHLLAGILAGYANRELQQIIDYLRTENAILRESLGQRRIRLNDDQR